MMSSLAKVSLLRESKVTLYMTESTYDAKLGVMTTRVTSQAVIAIHCSNELSYSKAVPPQWCLVAIGNDGKIQQLMGDGILAKLCSKIADK